MKVLVVLGLLVVVAFAQEYDGYNNRGYRRGSYYGNHYYNRQGRRYGNNYNNNEYKHYCPKLNYPQNGVVQVTGVKPGDKATYKCETGYILVGYSTLTCQQYGTWSSHPPTCKRINCGPLPDIPNGRTNIAPDTMLGSIAIYTCNPGHKLIGIDQRHCQLDSTWSGIEPKCISTNCGPLPDIAYGRVIVTGTDFRDTAIYICDKGFKLVGDRERRCRSIGEWSSEEPNCVQVDCGTLPAPINGFVRFIPDTTLSSIAIFRCKPGLKLVGSSQRKCQISGEWSGTQPTCEKIKCPELKPPIWGEVYISGYYPGDHATYTCNYGHTLVGKDRRVCLHSGIWYGSDPTCRNDQPEYGYDDYNHNNGHYKYGDNYYDNDNDDDKDDEYYQEY